MINSSLHFTTGYTFGGRVHMEREVPSVLLPHSIWKKMWSLVEDKSFDVCWITWLLLPILTLYFLIIKQSIYPTEFS